MKLKRLYKLGLNHYTKHIIQSILLVLGIALGVSVIVAIDIANYNAEKSFQHSIKRINRDITHSIHGTSNRIDEEIYFDIRREIGYKGVSPVIEKEVNLPGYESRYYTVIGIDPFSSSSVRDLLNNSGIGINSYILENLLSERNAAIAGAEIGERQGLSSGDYFTVNHDSDSVRLRALGVLKHDDSAQSYLINDKIFVDISTAQEIFNYGGFLSRIDVDLGDEFHDRESLLRDYLSAKYPGVYLVRAENLERENKKLAGAFELNLEALSLITMLVAFFLIYNTFNYSLIVRREEFSILRSIGTTSGEISKLILTEALVLGVTGCIVGVLIGMLLGNISVDLVKRTYSNLYNIEAGIITGVSIGGIIKSIVIGLGSVLTAALVPSVESRYIKPINAARSSYMRSLFDKMIYKLLYAGLVLMITGMYTGLNVGLSVGANFVGLFALIIGYSLCLPFAMKALGEGICSIQRKFSKKIYLIAGKNYLTSIGTNFTATASLVIAVSVFLSMTVLIDSFRSTLSIWLSRTFDADIFISVPSGQSNDVLTRQAVDIISSINGIDRVGYSRRTEIVTDAYGSLNLLALSENPPLNPRITAIFDNSIKSFNELVDKEVLVSESLYRRNIGRFNQNMIDIPTSYGVARFRIKGLYTDFASQRGTMVIRYDAYSRYWADSKLTSISFDVLPGVDTNSVLQDVSSGLGNLNYKITTNTGLKEAAYRIFEQTFVITKAMRVIAFVVAFFGILGALLSLELSKNKQMGILRSIGTKVADIRRIILIETTIVGFTSGLLSIPIGIVMSYVLVKVINFKSFGWSIDFLLDNFHLGEAVVVSVVPALLAGIYPAYIFSRRRISELLKQE